MTQLREFTSWLAPHFEHFVELKHAVGVGYVTQRHLLLAFDRHVGSHAPPRHQDTGASGSHASSLPRKSQASWWRRDGYRR